MTLNLPIARSYLRGHGIDLALVGTVVVWAAMGFTRTVVDLPSLRAVAPVQVSVDLVLPALAAVLVCIATREPVPAVSVTSPRGRSFLRLCRISAVAAVAVLPALLLAEHPDVTIPRFLFLTAICLMGVRLLGGGAAWIAPAAYFVTATLVGNNRDGTFESWAWVLATTQSLTSTLVAIGSFVAAALWWSLQQPERDRW
ncbi:hypothetical protein [Kribbella sp. CA-293567]|uniref:hypothetical protein n=1 Tax=Kribbella sp. CA-293567 TaxID=3002436 RepID=UPI0022DD2185|nr:hypothetical protein [Kribbella sp. CA-293567]WBQ04992.1 hypothetical protein OX958_34200 [Kribbella sp. CA-293567]